MTDAELLKLGKLSRLEILPEEIELYKSHFDKMLKHIDHIKTLDLSDVEPLCAVDAESGVLREDIIQPGLSQELAFMNAPFVEFEHFAIPKVIGGE
jgi:aspartyl-tRNA(Asn)/glutamyl-tRNA(Gln) amidotransferase subunit C